LSRVYADILDVCGKGFVIFVTDLRWQSKKGLHYAQSLLARLMPMSGDGCIQ
jgi:hypothetical protein